MQTLVRSVSGRPNILIINRRREDRANIKIIRLRSRVLITSGKDLASRRRVRIRRPRVIRRSRVTRDRGRVTSRVTLMTHIVTYHLLEKKTWFN